MPPQRLQKILARSGFGSRRACEAYIAAGRVTVNGQRAGLGQKADPGVDEIRLDGELIQFQEELVYLVLNKPLGVLSSLKSQGGLPTVIDLIDVPQRVYPVGRLDLDSQGLILLTNDGNLANKLTHPRYGHEKEYQVLLNKAPDERQLAAWRRGVTLKEGEKTLPTNVQLGRKSGESQWVKVILKQGRKRQLRETAEVLGLKVRKLVRVRIGPIHLGNLKSGMCRPLTAEEERRLKASLQKPPSRRGSGRRSRRGKRRKA